MPETHNEIPPILGVTAHKGTGKTTLLTALLPLLCERGICVGLIKQTRGDFDLDRPGTDSFELRKAGAQQVLLASEQRWALMVERESARQPKLEEHIAHLDHGTLDLILVEDVRAARFPQIELHRPALGKPLLFPGNEAIIAVASDSPLILPDPIECLDLNHPPQIADFIVDRCLPDSFACPRQDRHGR